MSGMGGNSGYTKRSTYGGGSSSHGYDNYVSFFTEKNS